MVKGSDLGKVRGMLNTRGLWKAYHWRCAAEDKTRRYGSGA